MMGTLALKLLLRKIDRTAITILMLVPIVTLLVGSNLLIVGYANQAQSTLSVLHSGGVFTAYSDSPMNYSTFQEINSSRVSWALPFLQANSTLYSSGKELSNVPVIGTMIQPFENIKRPAMYYPAGNSSLTGNEIAVGAILSELSGIKLGNIVQLSIGSAEYNFTVGAIMNSSSEYDVMIVMPLSLLWKMYPQLNNSISYVEFLANSQYQAPSGLALQKEGDIASVATTFASDTSNLVTLWSYAVFALVAVSAVVASFRIVSGSSLEFETLRTLGSKVGRASRLLLYQHAMISLVSVVVGVSSGIVITQMLSTFVSALLHVTIVPQIDVIQLAFFGVISFMLMFVAGIVTISLLVVKK